MACGLSTALCQILRPAGFSFPASCVCFQYRWSPNCGIYPPFDDPPQSGYHGEKAPQGQEPPAPPREGDTSDGASAVFGDAEAEDKRGYSGEVDYTPNGVGSSVTTNTGEVLDTTPSKTHFTTNKNPGANGTPNSSVDIVDSHGKLKTRRWYNENGQAIRDVDFTNHGNPKLHPVVPHEHTWNGKLDRE